MAIDAGKSPSTEVKAYAAAVPSRKKLCSKAHHIRELRLDIRRYASDLQSKENENLGPNTGDFAERIDTESLEGSENYQNGGPSVPERERKVHEYFVTRARRRMLLLDDVVNMLTRICKWVSNL